MVSTIDSIDLDALERVILERVVARRERLTADVDPIAVGKRRGLSEAMQRESRGYIDLARSPLTVRAMVRAAAYVAQGFADTAGKPLANGKPTVGAGYGVDPADLAADVLRHYARWLGKLDKDKTAVERLHHKRLLANPGYAWNATAGNADRGTAGVATRLARNLKGKQKRLIPVGNTERVQGSPDYARTLDDNGQAPSDLRAAATIYGPGPIGVPEAIANRQAPLGKRLAAAGVSDADAALVVRTFDATERSQRLDKRGYLIVNKDALGRDAYRVLWADVDLGGLSLPNARRRVRAALVVLAAYDSKQARRDNAAFH